MSIEAKETLLSAIPRFSGTGLSSTTQQRPAPEQPMEYRAAPQQQQQPQQTQNMIEREIKKKISLTSEFKWPVVVAIIFFLLNVDVVNKHIVKNFPKLVNNSTGDLNYIGIGIKSIVMGLVYYLIKYFE